MSNTEILFKHADGSFLYEASAKWLCEVPVWAGQRTLNEEHGLKIYEKIRGNPSLVNTAIFTVAVVPAMAINEISDISSSDFNYLLDGQHRQFAIRRLFSENPFLEDFTVLVRMKEVSSSKEIIHEFRVLNSTLAMKYSESEESKIHKFIMDINERLGNRKKVGNKVLVDEPIKLSTTHRPWVSEDDFTSAIKKHKYLAGDIDVDEAVEKTLSKNKTLLLEAEMYCSRYKISRAMQEKAMKIGFMLGLDPKFSWMAEL
jgi:hypothetical protein